MQSLWESPDHLQVPAIPSHVRPERKTTELELTVTTFMSAPRVIAHASSRDIYLFVGVLPKNILLSRLSARSMAEG